MDTSTSRDNVGDRSTTTQDEQCQSDNDGDSISTGSTCSSCVSSCPSFVNQRDPLGHYRLVETLGIGEFGKIKLGIHTETDQKVAIKIIKKRSDPTILAKIEREIEILKSLRHPHIVKLIEVVETDTKIGIILEYASGGELFEYVLSHNSLDEDTARNLFAQLISSVKYMHVKGIVHRDLKLENMLFLDDEQTQLIVSDFGFANGDKKDLLKTSCGSPTYAAPELVFPSSNGYKGQAADIWSLGVILYCMVCGYLPFDDDPENPESANLHRLYQHIKSSTLSFPDSISPEAQDLIQHMLQPDPRKRCNIGFVIRHPWLKAH
ncbi:kinase-like domain-containing protein, partial [Chlamydoabsidia padenii]